MASSDPTNRLIFGNNTSPPTFLTSFNQRGPSDISNRLNAAGYGSHFTFSGGPFLPPSSTQSTTTNSPFTDSATTFGSISPQQRQYKSPPQPTGNLDTRLSMIPTPPPLQSSNLASIRQTYATSTPGINRHTANESASQSPSAQLVHHHHAPAIHSPLSEAGPPFNATEALHRLYLPGTMAGSVSLSLHPKVDRGFFLAPEDSEWTCYRRNYFQISIAYTIASQNPGLSNEALLNHGIMVDYHGRQERVTGFKLTIGARVYGSDAKIIDLVQHTPKRDKGPQLKPALNLMTPGGDVERHVHHDVTDTDEEKAMLSGNIPEGEVPRVVTYERIQFKQATANNGKRRAAQQYFSLIVEGYATILGAQGTEDIRVAVTKSSPVVVRGRSPGHYSDTPPAELGKSRPQELTTSTSFLRNEQPSPTQTPTRPVANVPTSQPSTSLTTTLPTVTSDDQPQPPNNTGNITNDLDFLASLEADFDGYQYLPFTLLDPQGKIVVPHDLFYDPHEFPDSHYANLLFGNGNDNTSQLAFSQNNTTDPFAQQGGSSGMDTPQSQAPTQTAEFSNLYQGFFDFPAQEVSNWNMGRGNSQQGSTAPGKADETPHWFDSFASNSASQNIGPGFRGNTVAGSGNGTGTAAASQQGFPFGFPGSSADGGNGGTNGGTMTPGGKWMFEFRNSSYGYFPNLPAVGEMHSSTAG